MLGPRECPLERLPSDDVLIYSLPGIHSPQWRIRETPIASIEAEALVYERRCISLAWCRLALENGLASVAVAGPLIKDEDASKIVQIDDVLKPRIGQVVKERGLYFVA